MEPLSPNLSRSGFPEFGAPFFLSSCNPFLCVRSAIVKSSDLPNLRCVVYTLFSMAAFGLPSLSPAADFLPPLPDRHLIPPALGFWL